jgi:hypothetical protein
MQYLVTYRENGVPFDAVFKNKQEAEDFVEELKEDGCKAIKIEKYESEQTS